MKNVRIQKKNNKNNKNNKIQINVIDDNVSIDICEKSIETNNVINNQYINMLSNKTSEIKYLYHLSDIHIQRDSVRNKEFEDVFKKTAKQIGDHLKLNSNSSQALIVLTGDIIDFKLNISVNAITVLTNFFKLLSDIADVIVICGNHDVNVYNSAEDDLINSIYNNIQTLHKIHYLRETGLYKYNNIMFSHTSVFDHNKNIINSTDISNELIKVCLYHGFVYDKIKTHNLSYMLMNSHKKVSDFSGYDLVLLGDIHQRIFLDKNIAYASSLLQMNHGETINDHGFIIWNISEKHKIKSECVDVMNDYMFLNVKFINNILDDSNLNGMILSNIINKKIRLKIKYKNTHNDTLNEFINHLKTSNEVIEVYKEKIQIYEMKNKLQIDDSNNSIINYSNKEIQRKLIHEEIIKLVNLNKNDINMSIENILKYTDTHHNKIGNLINTCNPHNESCVNLKMAKLQFSNMFCYGENNQINFNNLIGIVALCAPNYSGKSSVFDILLYVLFDRISRNNIRPYDVVNKNAKTFSVELELYINDVNFIIKKSGTIANTNKRIINIYRNGLDITKATVNDNLKEIQNFLHISYDDFMMTSIITQFGNKSLIQEDNSVRKDTIFNFLKLNHFDSLYEESKIINNSLFNELNGKINILNDLELRFNHIMNSTSDSDSSQLVTNRKIYLSNEINKLKNKVYDVNYIECDDIYKLHEEFVLNRDNISHIYTQINKFNEINDEIKHKINKIDDLVTSYNINYLLNNHCGSTISNDIKKITNNDISFLLLNADKSEVIQNIVHNILCKENMITEKYDISNKIYKLTGDVELLENRNIIIVKLIGSVKLHDNTNESYFNKNLLEILVDELNKINNDMIIRDINNKIKYDIMEKITKLKTEINELTVNKKIIEFYMQSVGQNGIPFNEAKKLCESMTLCVNEILSKFSEVTVSIELHNSGKKGTVEIYRTNGIKLPSTMSSGYEQMAIDLAIKITLSSLNHIKNNLFMADESFACADEKNIKNINKLFDFIKTYFSISIIISHDDLVKNMCDNQIFIKKENNISSITV